MNREISLRRTKRTNKFSLKHPWELHISENVQLSLSDADLVNVKILIDEVYPELPTYIKSKLT